MIKNNVLMSYKLQIPNLHFDISEKIENIIERMRSVGFVLSINHQEGQATIEITTNDYMILAYIRILLGEQLEVILVDKVLEIQQKIFIQYGVSARQQAMRWQLYEVKR